MEIDNKMLKIYMFPLHKCQKLQITIRNQRYLYILSTSSFLTVSFTSSTSTLTFLLPNWISIVSPIFTCTDALAGLSLTRPRYYEFITQTISKKLLPFITMSMKKIFTSIAILLFTLGAWGQNNMGTPYSKFGVGLLPDNYGAYTGMGGVSAAMRDNYNINF